MSYDLREKIHLIGYLSNQIIATKNLPSIRQVLAVLFYNLRRVSETLRVSAKLTIEECSIIWKKAKIPIQREDKCIAKLEAEYKKYRNIEKSKSRSSDTQTQNEKEYEESINKLFDIASANALKMVEVDQSDKQFLLAQRALVRLEFSDSDCNIANTNEPIPMEVENDGSNTDRDKVLSDNDKAMVVDASTLKKNDHPKTVPKEILDECLGPETESPLSQNTPPLKRRATEPLITLKLATTLDKCKVSKRDAMHLLMAAAEAFGVNTSDFVINTTSIHEARQKLRQERYEAIKNFAPNLFSASSSTIHWDEKMLTEYFGKKTGRLAIIVTCGKIEQLLGVPTLSSGTGENQAKAVFDSLTDWSLLENIEALSCDSTSSNTGRDKGACVLLEILLGKELLWLICRHHMYEIVLKGTFETKFGKSTGPDVPLFRKFRDFWKSIDQTKYDIGISDEFVNESLEDVKQQILEFCREYLKKDLIRDDYKEFLELVIIFLGGQTSGNVTFHPPGAIHHARWMAKANYSLKMFIFRKQFLLNDKDTEMQCRDVCIFIIRVYIQAWFCAPSAAQAPNQDLNFLKCLYEYRHIDQSISECTVKKFSKHLWYLTPELAALAFFDDNISIEEKMKMCKALESNSSLFVHEKRILTNDKNTIDVINSSMHDYICKDTNKFFERYKIKSDFLTKHPSTWDRHRDYNNGLKIVKQLRVVNDTAERGVKLMTEFNNLLTKNSDQVQYLLPVINEYRSLFPNSNKDTLTKPYN